MNKKRLSRFPLILIMTAMPFLSFAGGYEINNETPVVGAGVVKTIEGSEYFWIKTDDSDLFERIMKVSTYNNYRMEHSVFKVSAYGVNSDGQESSKNKELRSLYYSSIDIADNYFVGKAVTIYCESKSTSGMPECLIFRDVKNKKGDEIKILYNAAIIESGYSAFYSSNEPEDYNAMDKALVLSESIAKAKNIGVWSQKFNLLPDDF